ncbi:carbohydrate ABC transporter permease [Marinomonas communis]|uniref:Carbohydrate ABC transporter membrane protein 1 (CUT1 family) n=1 Tax=Marinomonas communis TaxID=28254 RepID=A0A4R6WXQ1_9GAMM|nr:sugar ABC transporter permease [Marinomonas communis]TDR05885.1 carbohydrate ABC transporter membrane protein 1 (CUT1 family) [Marinomonas communis]
MNVKPYSRDRLLSKRSKTKREAVRGGGLQAFFQEWLPKLVLSPTLAVTAVFVYGFILWTGYVSVSKSRMIPNYEFAGLDQYERLFNSPRWAQALDNLAVFGILYILVCILVGLALAVLLDQKIRGERILRPIFLYPMALSFIVTGTAWKWMLNPGLGIEKLMHDLGFENFQFDWIIDSDMAIYTIILAGVWQASGFVMAMFLAGLRGIDQDQVKAASIDGASMPRIYWNIILPQLRPMFMTAFVILAHMAIKSYDLVIAMTGGGPGFATELPATFMYTHTFTRNQLGVGAASAMIMLFTVAAVIVPYLYSELKGEKRV